jgi:hypothetical protein
VLAFSKSTLKRAPLYGLSGRECKLFSFNVEKNQIYSALFEQSPYDDIVQTYLEILLPSLGEMSARLFKPHLPEEN